MLGTARRVVCRLNKEIKPFIRGRRAVTWHEIREALPGRPSARFVYLPHPGLVLFFRVRAATDVINPLRFERFSGKIHFVGRGVNQFEVTEEGMADVSRNGDVCF